MLRSSKVRQCRPYRTALHCARKLLGAKAPRSAPSELVISVCALHELQSLSSPTSKRTKKPQSGSPLIGCRLAALAPRRIAALAAEPSLPARPARRCLLTSCACGPAATHRRAGVAGGNHRAAARWAAVSRALRHEVVGAQLREGNAMPLFGERAEAHSRSHVQFSECMRVRSSVCAR